MSRARRRAGSLGFFFSSRRRHTRYIGGWSSDVCSSDLLLGPTGGYLLAYPVAAWAVGAMVRERSSVWRVACGVLAGLVLIHLGGLAQLAILTGNIRSEERRVGREGGARGVAGYVSGRTW